MRVSQIRVMLDALKEGRCDHGTLNALALVIESLITRHCGAFGDVEPYVDDEETQ